MQRRPLSRTGIGCCALLVCGALVATAQTNQPARPARPIELVTRIGECDSRIGKVEVVVCAVVQQERSTIKIQCRFNHAESACEIDPTNAVAVAQLIQNIASALMKGKQSSGQHRNIGVSSFELEDKEFVELMFHRGDSIDGEPTCRLWFDSYNALSLSHLILSGTAATDWLAPILKSLE